MNIFKAVLFAGMVLASQATAQTFVWFHSGVNLSVAPGGSDRSAAPLDVQEATNAQRVAEAADIGFDSIRLRVSLAPWTDTGSTADQQRALTLANGIIQRALAYGMLTRLLTGKGSPSLAYYGFGDQIGFTHVSRARNPGFRELVHEVRKPDVSLAEMSSGQLHFFLENRRAFFGYDEEGRFAEELIYILRERFRWEPHHVRLAILHAVGFARPAPEERLRRLIEAINALEVSPDNWAISSSIIDALRYLEQ